MRLAFIPSLKGDPDGTVSPRTLTSGNDSPETHASLTQNAITRRAPTLMRHRFDCDGSTILLALDGGDTNRKNSHLGSNDTFQKQTIH